MSKRSAEQSLARLADRAEINDLMLRWCRAVDRCEWRAIKDIFHPDGRDDHGIYKGDIDGLIAWLSERHKSVSRSMHIVTNMLIEFADDDNAFAETYCLAVQRYPGGGGDAGKAISGGTAPAESFDMLMTGRYLDHFRRRQGEWRVQNRVVAFDNSMRLPVPQDAPQLAVDWAVSARDTTDPMWALRARLGLSR